MHKMCATAQIAITVHVARSKVYTVWAGTTPATHKLQGTYMVNTNNTAAQVATPAAPTVATVGLPAPSTPAQVAIAAQAKRVRKGGATGGGTAKRRAPGQTNQPNPKPHAQVQAALSGANPAVLAALAAAPAIAATLGGAQVQLPPATYLVTWVGMRKAPKGGRGAGNAACIAYIQALASKGTNTVANVMAGLTLPQAQGGLGNPGYLLYALNRGYATAAAPKGKGK